MDFDLTFTAAFSSAGGTGLLSSKNTQTYKQFAFGMERFYKTKLHTIKHQKLHNLLETARVPLGCEDMTSICGDLARVQKLKVVSQLSLTLCHHNKEANMINKIAF